MLGGSYQRPFLSLHSMASQMVFCAVVALISVGAQAQQYSIVYAFNGADDLTAGTSIARDTFGNLYGASNGSLLQCAGTPCGAIYKVTPSGQETTLYYFQGPPDGADPVAVTVVPGSSINDPATIYGTTAYGGTSLFHYCDSGAGCGTLFRLSSSGVETVLHSFNAPPGDGIIPQAGVTVTPGPTPGSSDVVYGTTYYGGPYSVNGNPGEGTVYKIANGREILLYSFTGGVDGALPAAAPLFRQGVLYGTTVFGGTGNCVTSFRSGCGTVFKVAGNRETVLYSFQDGADGGNPAASLIADSAGNLYGTAVLGGDLNCQPGGQGVPPGCGVIFKVSPSGVESVLYTFTGGADGAWPSAALVRDSAGNLYGTAVMGGDLNCGGGLGCGTVFKLDSAGHFMVLHAFIGSDGWYPVSLLEDNQGVLYGVTQLGGPAGKGTLYQLVP